jgi:hypothetical protein
VTETPVADAVQFQIAFDTPEAVRRSLAALGRTEDVRFAPAGRRLAFACYGRGHVAIADLDVGQDADVVVTSLTEHRSPLLQEPHGLDFVDDDTLVVGNRAGGLVVFRLPPVGVEGELTLVGALGKEARLDGPGSVAVRATRFGSREVLVCNNWSNAITRHPLEADGVPSIGGVALRKWLDLPDGLAVSGDGEWLAVSNHNSHTVLIYACAHMHEDADPVGILRGVRYPHGIRFAPGDRQLLVADAAAPNVHVFSTSGGDWNGVRYPSASLRVMDDETFAAGRHNPQEGGPKGIDVRTNVLAVTSEGVPLAFFDVAPAFDGALESTDDRLGYELHALDTAVLLKQSAATASARLAEIQRTKSWRALEPLRRAYGAVRRLRPGGIVRRGP